MTTPPIKGSATDTSIPTSTTLAELLEIGKPFVNFDRYSILDLKRLLSFPSPAASHLSSSAFLFPNGSGGGGGGDGSARGSEPETFSQWLSSRLQIGKPFVIQDFEKLPEWDKGLFSIEGLIDQSTKKNIPIRNCSTNRDLSFTLKKFSDAARLSHREFKNLYARDLQCPEAWLEQCKRILPPEVQWGGRLDLFQWLPSCARSEVMMAYVGSEGSSSGFHRCFSSTVALNLLVDCGDRPVLCFGTDFNSQAKYDSFMAARGASPHVDWLNWDPEELQKADFPLYVCEQRPGDLVVFPPATAHQVWNLGSISTKLVWNILHPLSLEAGMHYVQPPFNRLCHPDVARSNLSLACAMLSLVQPDVQTTIPPDLALLTRLFRQMVHDESIKDQPATPMSLVRIPETAIATCNFCGTAIWNRHLRCNQCQDFDLCLMCYLNGRSCEHSGSYSWAEILPPEKCRQVLRQAEAIIQKYPSNDNAAQQQLGDYQLTDSRKSLGTAVNELIVARQNMSVKLCHLCRIDHLEWKGRRCDRCSAFFCYRGLYRHFDMNSGDVMRHAGLWVCPKCSEKCNCRCCHFASAYVKAEKPASKRRVKPADPRGKIMGFTDNVFDQKKRNTPVPPSAPFNSSPIIKTQKRPLSVSTTVYPLHSASMINIPTPESDSTANSQGRRDSAPEVSLVNGHGATHHSKIRRTSIIPGKASRQAYEDVPFGKTLHGIDYITQMPSPRNERLSLPPLKNNCKLNGSIQTNDPIILSTTSSLNTNGMTALANVATSRGNESTALSHNRMRSDRDIKSDVSSEAAFPHTSTITTNLRNGTNLSTLPASPQQQQQSLSSTALSTKFKNTTPPPPNSQYPNGTVSVINGDNSSFSTAQPTPNSPISALKSQLHRLRQYSEELLSLSLFDSNRILQEEIQRLEASLLIAKKERGERLLQNLEREFPALVDVHEGMKREGTRMGYF